MVSTVDIDTRVEAVDWASASAQLDGYGWTMLEKLLTSDECRTLAGFYEDDRRFRSRVVMARHGFGRGEYKYFAYPLPAAVTELRAGQMRPTPLLLQYAAGDFNALHQDLYGEHVFPLQMTIMLSEPEQDFTGGEFVLTEQRPRMQSKAEVVPLRRGDAVVFAVRDRPVQGTRGIYRVMLKHGVSRLRSGHRQTLGVIFHDAK